MLVEVAVPVPVPKTFTYRIEGDAVTPGTRVLVPFGPRRLVGWVVGEPAEDADVARIRSVVRVLDERPTVPPELLRLCRWMADYYAAPVGQVLRSALPSALSDRQRTEPPVRTRRVLRLTRELPSLQQRDELFGRAGRQREAYELLESLGGTADVAHLTGQLGFSYSVLNGLAAKDVAAFGDEVVERDPFADTPPAEPPRLVPTPAQRRVIRALVDAANADASGTAAAPVAASPPRRVAASAKPFLLRGVTGSGKTLVYIELLKEVVGRQGRGAIVLVPEIALTPQTVARFRAWFGDDVAVLHSALSDGERYDAWRALLRGDKRIAVGARSAVFAPVARLGAIVVDEEHEATYKQSEAPRYHAREVAIMRARAAGAVCLLGSATPSLESWQNAQAGKSRLLELPDRVEGRPLPPVRIIDMRKRSDLATRRRGDAAKQPSDVPKAEAGGGPEGAETRGGGSAHGEDAPPAGEHGAEAGAFPEGAETRGGEAVGGGEGAGPVGGIGDADGGNAPAGAPPGKGRTYVVNAPAGAPPEILSEPLVRAIEARLERSEQTILLLNRRGYSSFVQCRACGNVWQCERCNVSLTFHRARQRLVCHYCFHEEKPPTRCDACGAADLSFRGIGTEQVERAVAETFPAARVARMDVDTTSAKWSHHRILGRVERGEVDILLGTQMIAKGLDFPRVTLVGVINADVGLNLPDFRASERAFQLLTQVAGRAGRGERGGEVLIQTALPGHYAVVSAAGHDYAAFAVRELDERLGPNYPPHCRMANLVVSGLEEVAVQEAAAHAAAWVRALLGRHRVADVEVTGPAPCPIDRVRGRWRWHFLLRSPSARRLGRVCTALHERYALRSGKADLRLAIDRDPVALL